METIAKIILIILLGILAFQGNDSKENIPLENPPLEKDSLEGKHSKEKLYFT